MAIRRAASFVLSCLVASAIALPARAGAQPSSAAGAHAHAAYDRALAMFDRSRADGAAGEAGGRGATIALRDLARALPALTPAEQRVARSLLARPSSGKGDLFGVKYTSPESYRCDVHVCVHWVTSTVHAVPLDDVDANGVPDYVQLVMSVLGHVWSFEVDKLGYRAPLRDSSSKDPGPNGKLDVYLADVGGVGIYGYCTSDDPRIDDPGARYRDVSAYCVLDNDYSASEFPSTSGEAALQVTAAHEFFHAVQFAYDWLEDSWLMEGTATWIEDEVYDAVDDNRQYLEMSPLTRPWVPLDTGTGLNVYGSWIFWRYLSERFGRAIVHDVWGRVDAAPGGPDRYSLQAVSLAVAARGIRFPQVFAAFAVANVTPSLRYSEGAAYPAVPAARTHAVTGANRGVSSQSLILDHLTDRRVAFVPSKGVRSTDRLDLVVHAPSVPTLPKARFVIHLASGGVRAYRITLDPFGDGHLVVPFGKGVVDSVDLMLVNASTRTTCWTTTYFSCQGTPTDDDLTFGYAAVLRRST